MRLVIKFLKDESGATAIEYSLIAAGIALAVITVVNRLGSLDELELIPRALAGAATHLQADERA